MAPPTDVSCGRSKMFRVVGAHGHWGTNITIRTRSVRSVALVGMEYWVGVRISCGQPSE